jgi:SNF2 family DNA or RNA helicase
MLINKYQDRIIIIADTPDEKQKLREFGFLEKAVGRFSCEDSLVNRLLLDWKPWELERTSYWYLPENYVSPLREYQRKDVARMLCWKSLINANDMGLGKTIETIYYCKIAEFKKILIICPKAVIAHWVEQFQKWGPEFVVTTEPIDYREANVLIVNYEKVYHVEQFQGVLWDLVVCDEAHRIKNHKSQIGKIIHKIPSQNRLALTGTPITNLVDDMFNILFWVDKRSVGGGYWHFVDLFCHIPFNPFGKVIEGLTKNKERVKLLQRILASYVIRSTKEEVLPDLPKKGVYDITLSFDKKQRELYDDVKKLVFEKLPARCTISNAAIHLLRLIQVTSNPQIFKSDCTNPKFEYIRQKLDDNPEKSFVVFSQFAETVRSFAKFLTSDAVLITGSESIEERTDAVAQFRSKKVRVIVGTIGAMGQGIDGLQDVCSTVFFIDPSWSPQINQQAEDRVYRFGQSLPVDVYYLRLEKSVDQIIGKRLEEKEMDVRELL